MSDDDVGCVKVIPEESDHARNGVSLRETDENINKSPNEARVMIDAITPTTDCQSETAPVQTNERLLRGKGTSDPVDPVEQDLQRKKPSMRRSYQFRAMSRKAASYQKRQLFSNICCTGICPLMMVIISFGLGTIVKILINNGIKNQNILYCSNVDALNVMGYPITDISDISLPETEPGVVPFSTLKTLHVNFLTVDNGNSIFGTTSTSQTARPCAFYFSKRSPSDHTPYSFDADGTTGYQMLDSTFSQEPKGGWLTETNLYQMTLNFIKAQMQEWFVYSVSSAVNASLVGGRQKEEYNIASGTGPLTDHPFPPFTYSPVTGSANSSGIFDTLEEVVYLNVDLANFIIGGFTPIPYFSKNGTSSTDMDLIMYDLLSETLRKVAAIDKRVLFTANPSAKDLIGFFTNASISTGGLPFGGIVFNAIEHDKLQYNYTLHIGKDARIEAGAVQPTQGFRQLIAQAQLGQGLLRTSGFKQGLGSATISQSVRAFPILTSTEIKLSFASYVGGIIYPFGVSFLMPLFVLTMVQEKEARIAIMMKMVPCNALLPSTKSDYQNGVSPWMHYLSHYVVFYIIFALSSLIFLLSGYLTKLELFAKTGTDVLVLLFFVWGHSQISIAFFLSTLFRQSRLALVVTFLIVLCSVIVSVALDQLYVTGSVPIAILCWPPFAFYRALSTLNKSSYMARLVPYSIVMLRSPEDQVRICIIIISVSVPILLAVTAYLSSILPSNTPAPLPWYFPITQFLPKPPNDVTVPDVGGDEDVVEERRKVVAGGELTANSSLVLSGIRKTYSSNRREAVKGVTMSVDNGVVLGLLGPNGAGKSTLVGMLTGLCSVGGGWAKVGGYDLLTEVAEVARCVGVCPQHDILWDDLTVREHLLFYARVKGVTPKEEAAAVQQSLKSVELERFANRLIRGLSGGEKRRVSIAVALVGSPSVVFLDEPTTGLDPEVRRTIWDIISEARKDRTIVMTTHSMEEAEACCTRIGIMSKGALRCLASPQRLKALYGSGFKLQYTVRDPAYQRTATEWVETLLKDASRDYEVVDGFSTTRSYRFSVEKNADGEALAKIFEMMEIAREECGITDWGLNQESLEDIFLKLISHDDADSD